MNLHVGPARVRIVLGDITEQITDAVVNAANSTLMGGGGVDGAIHRRGGPRILEECKRIRETEWPDGLPAGRAVMTSGGNLKARYVIHTVGPIWRGGSHEEHELLASCYRDSLVLAKSKGLQSISFPSISTGAYGYPIERAHEVAVRSVKDFIEQEDKLKEVVFVVFSKNDYEVYEKGAKVILGG